MDRRDKENNIDLQRITIPVRNQTYTISNPRLFLTGGFVIIWLVKGVKNEKISNNNNYGSSDI